MANKFSSALKPQPAPTSSIASAPRPSRQSTKHIGGYYDLAVSDQLRRLALDERSSVQALLAEAIDMLFQARGLPMIARTPEEKASG
jgi:hypothetical protein